MYIYICYVYIYIYMSFEETMVTDYLLMLEDLHNLLNRRRCLRVRVHILPLISSYRKYLIRFYGDG